MLYIFVFLSRGSVGRFYGSNSVRIILSCIYPAGKLYALFSFVSFELGLKVLMILICD